MSHAIIRRTRRVTRTIALVLLACAFAACDQPASSPVEPQLGLVGHGAGRTDFEVYTQNVYLGGDTGPLFTLDFQNVPAVIDATNVFWQQVLDSDIPARAGAIVDAVADRMPHMVALQEVLRFVLLDGTFQPVGGVDFLGEIESAIASRGLPYETAVVQETTSSALPLAFDPAAGGISQWLAFTDRVVILRRTDAELVESAQGIYAAAIPLGPLELRRGWARATVELQGVPHHLVITHLETQATPQVQAAQAAELRGSVLAGLEGVTVLAGDLNSNAAAGPSDPTWTPTYGALISDGFVDVWDAAPHSRRDRGLTCCHDITLLGDSEFDQRIDFVLTRVSGATPPGLRRGHFRAEIVGEEESDRTASGLWPSDHTGLVASLKLPRSPW